MAVMDLIEKALNIRAFYHRVIAGNLANVDTPNYKERDIDFKAELERKMSGVDNIEVREKTDYDGLGTIDGNTVNIESQMMKLTENQLMFHSLIQVATKKISLMRYLISEGRR
jgi:flagellar basal-body rod protein FlgB